MMTFQHTMSWRDPEGNITNGLPIVTSVPYEQCFDNMLPVPGGTPAGTEIDLPFPGILQDITCLRVINQTGQELGMAFGGNYDLSLPVGAMQIFTFPVPVVGSNRYIGASGVRFWTTVIQPTPSPGCIHYLAFGM